MFPWTDPENGYAFYPMRPAYASTLMKMQGATLSHMTIWLDTPGVEAAGYVALSRVQHDKELAQGNGNGMHVLLPGVLTSQCNSVEAFTLTGGPLGDFRRTLLRDPTGLAVRGAHAHDPLPAGSPLRDV